MIAVLELLRRAPAFAALSDGDLGALGEAFRAAEYPAGHTFLREGERGETVFLVVQGEVVVLRAGAEINRMRPGQLFGLMALVDGGPRSATARAADTVWVAKLSTADASTLAGGSPAVALAFQRAIARQLARDFRHLDALLRQRLGDFGHRRVKG